MAFSIHPFSIHPFFITANIKFIILKPYVNTGIARVLIAMTLYFAFNSVFNIDFIPLK